MSGTDAERQRAATSLVRRIVGHRADDVVVTVEAADDDLDVVDVEAADGQLRLTGTSGVAIAVGLRRYLEQAAGVQVTWLDEPIPLLDRWPSIDHHRVAARFPLRYHLNYVTFAYSTVYWDWDRWEREIDRMALHGINAPLALTGHEAVWRAALRAEGMADDRIAAYLGGATYLPFLWMGCLEGWDRPLPEGWTDARERLGQRILARERALGMHPILPGFAGHVPAELAGSDASELEWEGFHSRQLPADHPRFGTFARRLRTEQRQRFSGDHLYATDPFIEMVPPSDNPQDLGRLAQQILDGVTVDDPDAVWVFQAWPFYYRSDYWTPDRVRAFLTAIPADRLLVLDLWAEHLPLWDPTDGFAGRPWLWCVVHNFGQRTGLFGDPRTIVERFVDARDGAAAGKLRGIGFTMEGLGTNPAIYDLVADLAWREPPTDISEWLADWAARRYGTDDDRVLEAWRLLAATVYGPGRDVLPPSPVVRRPGLDDEPCQGWAPEEALPDLATAWELLLSVAPVVRHAEPYERDVVDVAQHVLGGLIGRHRREITRAAAEGSPDAALAAGDTLLTLLDDLDDLLATRQEYLLGEWLDSARSWGATAAERIHLERSARRLVTVWGHPDTNLYDYSGRHWAGLVRGFYRPRFEVWLNWIAGGGSPTDPASAVALDRRLASFEEMWIRAGDPVRADPYGETIDVATELYGRWIPYAPPSQIDLGEAPARHSLYPGSGHHFSKINMRRTRRQ